MPHLLSQQKDDLRSCRPGMCVRVLKAGVEVFDYVCVRARAYAACTCLSVSLCVYVCLSLSVRVCVCVCLFISRPITWVAVIDDGVSSAGDARRRRETVALLRGELGVPRGGTIWRALCRTVAASTPCRFNKGPVLMDSAVRGRLYALQAAGQSVVTGSRLVFLARGAAPMLPTGTLGDGPLVVKM